MALEVIQRQLWLPIRKTSSKIVLKCGIVAGIGALLSKGSIWRRPRWYLAMRNVALLIRWVVEISCKFVCVYVYRVSQEERAKLQEGVPYVKLYRYNPKYLYPKLNGYGDNGHRKVWTFAFPPSVRLQLSSALTVREECVTCFFAGTSSAQRDKIAFYYCRYVQCLVTLRKTVIWLRVFL